MASLAKTESEKKLEDDFLCISQLGVVSVVPFALKTVFELGVFEIIAKAGPDAKLSASEIVAQLPARNPDAHLMLDRILMLLATHNVLGCSVVDMKRLYSLTSLSEYYVPNQDGVSLGPTLVLTLDEVLLRSWSKLKDAILEGGIPFNKVHGVHAFEYTKLDPGFNQVFNTGMFNHTTLVIKEILKAYKGFDHIQQLVDVGGGFGVSLQAITSAYPHIKGVNFDLPHVIQDAPSYPGVEHVGGNMFESVPNGDAIFMKWILHDWSDDHCLTLLKNCYKAIPGDGKIIVLETVLPVEPDASAATKFGCQCDVLMMTQNPGGKERTRHEYLALALAAGFSGIRFVCFVCNLWVMEFYK
ncbi:caffeic acid 3-O-methyltransferase-like [Tripterygium wilfordii]|uniref:caffeate O-methyltransferase n=1 Tax=Tripterygium wilfordii TaxID=458696 RepID=A0A7J7DC13_TRIWF|nr:anthranilate N-methyltransferase-like [Tripterygium wilfordii]KAF5743873.1 caffeic acid 3-O-methyltransferase-like [Tripterygium wilfordii]